MLLFFLIKLISNIMLCRYCARVLMVAYVVRRAAEKLRTLVSILRLHRYAKTIWSRPRSSSSTQRLRRCFRRVNSSVAAWTSGPFSPSMGPSTPINIMFSIRLSVKQDRLGIKIMFCQLNQPPLIQWGNRKVLLPTLSPIDLVCFFIFVRCLQTKAWCVQCKHCISKIVYTGQWNAWNTPDVCDSAIPGYIHFNCTFKLRWKYDKNRFKLKVLNCKCQLWST